MKKILLLLAMFATLPLSAQWFRQPTPNDTLRSTRVLADGRVLFQIYAPKASSVAVTGDLPWDRPVKFEKAENGVWKGVCEGLGDGCFRYSFLVDGVRVQDSKAPLSAEQASLLTKGEGYVRDVPHGAVAQRWYWSRTLACQRRMHVWTPAGYEKSAEALPVLYLIHGGGDNDAAWPGVGAAGWILDNLLAEGKIVPMIVVMPNGTIQTSDMMGEVPLFAEDMVRDIIPFVENNYRVLADQAHRAMAGLSMGGMETIETAFLHPELFDYVWVLSSSFSPGKQKEYVERIRLKEIAPALNRNFKALYFTQGGQADIAWKNCQEALGYLRDAGIRFEYLENAQAGHSWTTWRADLQALAPALFR
ncbi:MAG: endo-1,4-beta-xylanase Z [Bacteroidales bacterium]|nr:endo-1,4-beta-xylanase Z [Bacteroidales bacterium]